MPRNSLVSNSIAGYQSCASPETPEIKYNPVYVIHTLSHGSFLPITKCSTLSFCRDRSWTGKGTHLSATEILIIIIIFPDVVESDALPITCSRASLHGLFDCLVPTNSNSTLIVSGCKKSQDIEAPFKNHFTLDLN